MRVGIALPQVGEQATRANVIELAKTADKEGIDSLWVLDRLLWPLKPQTPYRGTQDGTLPVSAQRCLLYTSDAADDMQCVDLGGRRIIKK